MDPSPVVLGGFVSIVYFSVTFLSAMSSVDFKPMVLSELGTMYLGEQAAGERFKALAYKKAIDGIRRMEGPLRSIDDVASIEGVGKKIHDKIVEILQTGSLRSAERVKKETDVDAYQTLIGIHGVGPVKARELIAAGITTIATLRSRLAADPSASILNDTQTLGLKYYEAGIQRIPRSEMDEHASLLTSAIPSSLSGTIVGSYRRGAADSGDIDMLVTYNPSMSEKDAQKAFVAMIADLTRRGYIVDKLAGGKKKWMGYVRLPATGGAGADADAVPRRLDLLLTPPEEYAYAILYFTGSDKFNIAFRRHCLDKGYTLNEHTMKPTGTNPAAPPMATEADIFAFVGLKYVPPTARVDGRQIQTV